MVAARSCKADLLSRRERMQGGPQLGKKYFVRLTYFVSVRSRPYCIYSGVSRRLPSVSPGSYSGSLRTVT